MKIEDEGRGRRPGRFTRSGGSRERLPAAPRSTSFAPAPQDNLGPERRRHGDSGRCRWSRDRGGCLRSRGRRLTWFRKPIPGLGDNLTDFRFGEFHFSDLELGKILQRVDSLSGGMDHTVPGTGRVTNGVVTVHQPIDFARLNIDQQAVNKGFGTNQGAAADYLGGLDDILAFAAEDPEVLVDIVGQQMALTAEGPEPIEQLSGGSLGDLAIGVADNGDFLAALDGAGQGQ